MAERLRTFVQISDLHFGDLDPDSGSSSLDADAKDWWRAHPLFDGYLGHSHDALIHFAGRFARLEKAENASLVVTGDVTTVGKRSQFELARQYLEGAIQLDPANPIGLGVPGALAGGIPGNHDHWPGSRRIVGSETAEFDRIFPAQPVRITRSRLTNRSELVFVAIDSDADVRPYSSSRLLARGRFVSQLTAASSSLGPPKESEIRILLLHHSPSYVYPGVTKAFEIESASRAALDRLVREREIVAILTGHIHGVPIARTEPITYRSASWSMLEARCGTTLQRDEPPLSWNGDYSDRFSPNTFLAHRLFENDDGSIDWEVSSYVRTLRGFREQGRLLPPVRVWPRH